MASTDRSEPKKPEITLESKEASRYVRVLLAETVEVTFLLYA